MTAAQERHLESIQFYFSKAVGSKYRKGQEEHGGNLFDMSVLQLIDAALDEAIDQITYLKTLRDKIEKAPIKPGAVIPCLDPMNFPRGSLGEEIYTHETDSQQDLPLRSLL